MTISAQRKQLLGALVRLECHPDDNQTNTTPKGKQASSVPQVEYLLEYLLRDTPLIFRLTAAALSAYSRPQLTTSAEYLQHIRMSTQNVHTSLPEFPAILA